VIAAMLHYHAHHAFLDFRRKAISSLS